MSASYLERVVLGEDRGISSWVIRGLLWPLSFIYRAGLAVFLSAYYTGIRKKHRLDVPVVSIGNLTFGGTGKTPAVRMICRMLVERGKNVVILSRGHGGAGKCRIVSDESKVLCGSDESGDEPMMLAMTLPGVPVVVGKDRRESGTLACRELKPDVIVLDDGLQYWQLHRDLDIIVLDAVRPFGSGLVMPAGDLREPARGLSRAGVILLNNSFALNDEQYARVEKQVSRIAPNARIFRCDRRPECFRRVDSGEETALDSLRRRRAVAFCGIGRPEGFFQMLESLGVVIEQKIVFADHHRFSDEDIARLEKARCSSGAEITITTEKDLARLGRGAASIKDIYVLSIELEIRGCSRFAEYVADRIDSANTQTPV